MAQTIALEGALTAIVQLLSEAKRLDLLHQLVPQATMLAYLAGQSVVEREMQRDATAAAGSLGLQLVTVEANSERD